MNPRHLQSFIWLRWRILVNRMKRGGIANAVILAVLAGAGILIVLFLLAASFVIGFNLLADAAPLVVLFVWDGVVIAFLFVWLVGMMTDLQRSEVLSMDKFLHLPVTLTSAFLINYVSSLPSLTMMLFFPAMVGLSLGLVLSRGPAFLLVLPLLAAFLFMVTALTYQFQGWLASLMANKRRRQTVIVVVTMAMILVCQLPNLLNFIHPWESSDIKEHLAKHNQEIAALDQALAKGEITPAQRQQQATRLQDEFGAEMKENERRLGEAWTRYAYIGNLAFPPGWLPLGASELAHGDLVPALLGMLGLALIGGASFWRAYRTTVRFYTGQMSARISQPVTAVAKTPQVAGSALFLEKKIPGLPEQATVIALATFRSLLRAPEAKMMLLSPIIMVVVFGSMLLTRAADMPVSARPLLPFGSMAIVLLSMVALAANQFGFDRNGFRSYVLSPVARRDILLGKNMAVAPLALGLSSVLALVFEFAYPLRPAHLLAVPFQLVSMFLVFCLLANGLSIIAPMAVATGLQKTSQSKGLAIVLNLAFVLVFPLAMAPMLLPLGFEVLVDHLGYVPIAPITLLLTIAQCADCRGTLSPRFKVGRRLAAKPGAQGVATRHRQGRLRLVAT